MEKKHNIDKYPGYPHYPGREDITRINNNDGTEDINESTPPLQNDTTDPGDSDSATTRSGGAEITPEDLRLLDAAEQNMNTPDARNLMGSALDNTDNDGDPLNEDTDSGMDMTGEGLDIPGSAVDDANEQIGEEDEENNYYSLGGDLHETQEENKDI